MKPPAKGRADLVRWMHRLEPGRFERLAERLGYERRSPDPEPPPAPAATGATEPSPVQAGPPESPPARLVHYRLTARRRLPRAPEPLSVPAPGDPPPEPEPTPLGPPPPLVPWSRLWPFLHLALGEQAELHRPDLPRLVSQLARGRQPRRLPRKRARRWALRCQLLLDGDDRLYPFQGDFHDLLRRLRPLRGDTGLEILRFERGPEGMVRPWSGREWGELRPYRLPEPGTRVLVLSDLGALGPAGVAEGWRWLGRRLHTRGIRPVLLGPCPARWWDPAWKGLYFPVVWDSAGRLPPSLAVPRPWPRRQAEPEAVIARDRGARHLLSLLSAAVFVEPTLLRHLRLRLPAGLADVGSELAAWLHPQAGHGELALLPGDQRAIRSLRAELKEIPREQLLLALDLMHRAHREASRSLRMEERLVRAVLLEQPDPVVDAFLQEVREAWEDPDLSAGSCHMLYGWTNRVGARRHPGDWARSPLVELLWYLVNRSDIARGGVALPEGYSLARVQGMLHAGARPRTWHIRQQGGQLHLAPAAEADGAFRAAGPVAAFQGRGDAIQTVVPEGPRALPLAGDVRLPPIRTSLRIQSDSEELELAPLVRPPWARSLGRDGQGLFVDVAGRQGSCRAYWLEPGGYPVVDDAGSSLGTLPLEEGRFVEAAQHRELVGQGLRKPAWAHAVGLDRYGVYADIVIETVVQRLRWLPPGEFLMGSPADEPGRYDDESLHPVILAQGLWLFDTPVTQALWQAVMGNNPSQFRSPERPVETVSWDDAQVFIERIERVLPGLGLRLPSEAEWEYACRADSRSAVYTGDIKILGENNVPALDPIAWYGGNSGVDFELDNGWDSSGWPNRQYPHEKAGTHPVKGKHPNAWGLYDMLGNVWEWCEDWYGDYLEEQSVDPRGPGEGERRVLRGGSWGRDGRGVRSACRRYWEPAYRNVDTGFRLARGPEPRQERRERQEQGRSATAASEGRTEGSGAQALRGRNKTKNDQ